MNLTAKQVIASTISFLTLFGMVWAGNEYLAKQKDIDYLEECSVKLERETAKRVELEALRDEFSAWKLEDRADAVQKRIWYLEDRYGCPNCLQPQKDEYRKLQYELERIREKLQRLYKEGGGKYDT